ncbi:15117_t:CDS:2, partial [Gigaspora rosea]
MCECLTALDIGEYIVKVNALTSIHKRNASIRPISSAVDKLDKLPWEDVKKEMTEEKGLDPNIADRIGEYVKLKGNKELLDKLFLDQSLIINFLIIILKTGLNDMALLFKYLEIFGVLDKVFWLKKFLDFHITISDLCAYSPSPLLYYLYLKISFDLSLARELDYYTGIIYKAVTEQSGPPNQKDSNELDGTTVGMGSIAAGGRYDNPVGMFASNKKGNIPCVGASIGVERVFSILLQKVALEQVKANEVCRIYVQEQTKITTSAFIRIKDMKSKEQDEGGGASIKRSNM